MKTDDPVKKPLPSIHLLDMQWTLQCLTNMTAAGEAEDLSLYNDDDDDDGYPMDEEEWFTDSSTNGTAPSTLLSQGKEIVDTS